MELINAVTRRGDEKDRGDQGSLQESSRGARGTEGDYETDGKL